MKITVQMLKQKRACAFQLGRFRRLWPDGCTPSLRVALRAIRNELNMDFVAEHFLSWRTRATFCWENYLAEAQYRQATKPTRERYRDLVAAAPYSHACIRARRAFLRADQKARRVLAHNQARAIWNAWRIEYPVRKGKR